ncbi:MAG TPA: hypothetical protein VFB68_18100 [Xanthobacteraceae bacterium]|nr:hypothetical protein [Xanthobacteraceae bacterium]
MRNRMTLAASSIVVLVVAASSLSAQPGRAQTAKDKAKADECQSRPGTSTPRGSHWFYRLERGTNRRCWYLGSVNQKRQAASTEQAAPAERAERAAPAPRRAASVPAPSPRPNRLRADEDTDIPANATAANAANANAPATAATTNAAPAAATQFSAGWPALPNGAAMPNDRDVTATVADNTATTEAAPENMSQADTPQADSSQADMPAVWPVLTANERTALAPTSDAPPGLGQLLIFLAATLAFIAIAVRAILKLASAWITRSRPMAPAARAAAPVIRRRVPGSPSSPERSIRQTDEATTAPAVERLREVAKRWEAPARMPRQPRIPAYEVMSEYEDRTPPLRRREVA